MPKDWQDEDDWRFEMKNGTLQGIYYSRDSVEFEDKFQRNFVLSHSAGVGDNLAPTIAQAVLPFGAG